MSLDSPVLERLGAVLRDPGGLRRAASNLLLTIGTKVPDRQAQTSGAFAAKWALTKHGGEPFERIMANQIEWYFDLYGFENECALGRHLSSCRTIIDCGAGTGFKAAWFARLAPSATVV